MQILGKINVASPVVPFHILSRKQSFSSLVCVNKMVSFHFCFRTVNLLLIIRYTRVSLVSLVIQYLDNSSRSLVILRIRTVRHKPNNSEQKNNTHTYTYYQSTKCQWLLHKGNSERFIIKQIINIVRYIHEAKCSVYIHISYR